MIREEGVNDIVAPFHFCEFAHAPKVRGALRVEVLLRGVTEHERQDNL